MNRRQAKKFVRSRKGRGLFPRTRKELEADRKAVGKWAAYKTHQIRVTHDFSKIEPHYMGATSNILENILEVEDKRILREVMASSGEKP